MLYSWHQKAGETLLVLARDAETRKENEAIVKRFGGWLDHYKKIEAWEACEKLLAILARGPDDLKQLCPSGKQLDLQLLAVPWVSRSGLMSYLDLQIRDLGQLYEEMEKRLANVLEKWLDQADPNLPIILTAHASVEGAVYGGERSVLLGKDFVLPKSMVTDPRLDYVALGHIHKAQNLNEGNHPPVIYSGSIERVDFGEVKDDKFFVVADVQKGKTETDWRKLEEIRPFHDRFLELSSQKDITAQVISALPAPEVMKDAVIGLE